MGREEVIPQTKWRGGGVGGIVNEGVLNDDSVFVCIMPVREMVLMTIGLAELLSPAPQLHQRSVKTTKTLNLLGLL